MIVFNSARLLLALALVFICNSQSISSDTFDIVELLGRIKFPVLAKTVERCLKYEEQLRQNGAFSRHFFHKTRHQLYQEILHSALRNSDVKLTVEEKRVLSDLRACLTSLEDTPSPADAQQSSSEPSRELHEQPRAPQSVSIDLNSSDRLTLSRVQHDTRTVSLEQRCQSFDENLRQILDKNEPDVLSSAALFQRSIEALSERHLPFGNKDPVLAALQECVDNFPKYRAVSTNVIQQKSSADSGKMAPTQVRDMMDKLRRSGYDYMNLERRFEEQSRKLEMLERELASLKLTSQQPNIDDQMSRLKDNQIAMLKEQLVKVKQMASLNDRTSEVGGALERSRYLQMKQLYEQAAERESRTNEKLKETERRLVELVSKLKKQ